MTRRPSGDNGYSVAFETSGAIGSVALGRGGDILDTRSLSAPLRHAVEFLPTVEALCRTYDVASEAVRRVHVSIGPGSFTGLRIGVTAARTIAFAARPRGLPPVEIVPVPTLDVIAQNASDSDDPPPSLVVILDAKRKRVYGAAYARKERSYVATAEPAELDPAAFLGEQSRDCGVIGEGVTHHRAVVESSGLRILPESLYRPRAETVYCLGAKLAAAGRFAEPRTLVPLYIRLPEAEEKWAQRTSAE